MQRPTIYFVTTNAGKLREARALFQDYFDVEQVDMAYPELQDEDLSKIAAYGARYCADLLGREVIVEDSGLFIDALNGFPGPYSSYVQKTIGNKGILKLMEGVEGRRAEFRSVVGYCKPGEEPTTFTGIWWGDILYEETGTNGFGFDPIFSYRRFPVGEMTLEQKNEVSHRRRSMIAFRDWYLSKTK
ncbi:non-canonical purine NTP pyrophosphatase, rdgB/HAM1 family [Methanocella conradii HZ254]|uniref:dITP/XTP pyrophosphatase n=1 Tax=Methanocella conradii (strain DSM 24694 / JCM 17849 / CGMCC 1.5162 / HZ254) TaxID=1041930 RepID=H8IA22_METCZ|nr:XTP/dITP diphosphatase [Methanocella conradii]AFC99088.1 non-canonical purine NTP pyrophosphatase, rdgB/HAM1 family [Methanocella conradii HZ254]